MSHQCIHVTCHGPVCQYMTYDTILRKIWNSEAMLKYLCILFTEKCCNTPTGDELKQFLKEGGVGVFSRVVISLENTPTSHTVSLTLVICACSDSAMPLLSRALWNNSNQCLPSFVSPSSCIVLLLRCFLFNITAYSA